MRYIVSININRPLNRVVELFDNPEHFNGFSMPELFKKQSLKYLKDFKTFVENKN